ncbi:MAG TPA: hypothetical protein VG826_29285 [Pirellulales bacterium]|nr:hypothetical protein [Pirellulales bacterium]
MKALVIPSNREEQLDGFLRAWEESGQADWDVVVLSEDSDEKRMRPRCPWPLHHSSHAEVRDRLRQDAWIISRGDSARRCFGFLVAADLGAEWVLTLDDDCRPLPESGPICQAHLDAIGSHLVCQPTAGCRTRGLPYRDRGYVWPMLNMGLWTNVPDLDAPQSLVQPQSSFMPPAGSRLANPQCRYPLCGMNLFFHVDLLPALYFPLMGEGQLYRRFDDIWAGWGFQKLAEHCRVAWSFGEPWIEHQRASDPFRNLVAEAPGIARNETMWRELNEIRLASSTLIGAAADLAEGLRSGKGYLAAWGRALQCWLRHASRSPVLGEPCAKSPNST